MKKTIIISINSGIGISIANRIDLKEEEIIGTYRNPKKDFCKNIQKGVQLFELDINNDLSISKFYKSLQNKGIKWDQLIICSGTLFPIIEFENCTFEEWEQSFNTNFISQSKIVHALLPLRNFYSPLVIFFSAGGGSCPTGFSAYNIAKVSLTKLCEYLDSEIKDTRFTSIGPGWVDTPIHRETLLNLNENSELYKETKRRIEQNDFVDFDKISLFLKWLYLQPKEIISGKNLSIEYDIWEEEKYIKILSSNKNAGKLRRYMNQELNNYH